jgi:predicted RNA polymerase sigma factor
LLAVLLITDARRESRIGDTGELITFGEQDRGRWDAAKIAEGTALLDQALPGGRRGPYQLHAAIAASYVQPETDWREIAALDGELARGKLGPGKSGVIISFHRCEHGRSH